MTTDTAVQATQMVNLTIDGNPVTVPKGTTVYTAAKNQGIEIPIFCYQDRMPPFGACRMCLVEVEKMPKLQTSCTLEATEGMVVNTQAQVAVDGRREILEFLLINHPLDCPICDRGGECPLQDNTLKYGPGLSRFFEEKRHLKKHLPLGPVLKLDRERCIVCARCTRFSDIISGDHALEFIDRGYKTEVGTPDDRPVKSKFIGNTIMICPVGALTSNVYRFRARPWDNDSTQSSCTLCPVGCSMFLDSRDGEIVRTRSCENKNVNDIWLCDKGWFGYEFSDSPDRLQKPLIRENGQLRITTWEHALSTIAQKITEAKPRKKLAAFGGNPLTVEENYLFQQLMRQGAEVDNVDHRIGAPLFSLEQEGRAPGMEMSIGECEGLSYAVLCGLDLTEEFPVIWLRLRQAINRGAKVIFLGHFAPEISPYLAQTILHAPGQELETLKQHLPSIAALAEPGKKGALFVGRQYLATSQRRAILSELIKFRNEKQTLSLNIMEGCGNSMGARYAGMRPDAGPLGKKINNPGLNAVEVLENAANKGWDFLYVAGANPAVKFPSELWKEARKKLGFLVVQDLFLTETANEADVVLPALSYVEKVGSFVNIEGRVQRLQPGKDIPTGIYSDEEIFITLAQKLNVPFTFDSAFAEKLYSGFFPIQQEENVEAGGGPEQVHSKNNEGLYASFAPELFDQGVRMKHNIHVAQLAKDPRVRIHPEEADKRNLKDNDPVRLKANGNSISAKVRLDKQVALKTVVLPLGFTDIPVHELGTNLMNGLSIELHKEV